MLAFREKAFEEVKECLDQCKAIGIISCGGCPALQKKGGSIGVDRWKNNFENSFEVKWGVVINRLCDERLFKFNMIDLCERLEEVDAVVVMACEPGSMLTEKILGFKCVLCLETLYFGVMRRDGHIEKYCSIKDMGVE